MKWKAFWLVLSVLVIGALGMAFVPVWAEGDEKEREVTINEVPQPVKEIIIEQAGRNRVREIEEVRCCGWWFYEAEWVEDGKEVEIEIALGCKLVGREVEKADEEDEDGDDEGEEEENEKEVSLGDVPAPVKEIIIKEAGNNKIQEIEVVDLGGWWIYEAEWITKGKEVEISIVLTCLLIDKEVEEGDEVEDDEHDDDD